MTLRVLLTTVFLLGLASPAMAFEDEPSFGLSTQLGWRYSAGAKGGGFVLGVTADAYLGPVMLGFETQATNDHSLRKTKRVAGRVLSWINLGARIPMVEQTALIVAGGVGGGWIHAPDDKTHFDAWGIHETIRFQAKPDESMTIQVGINLEQLWQDGIIDSMDFGVTPFLGTGFSF